MYEFRTLAQLLQRWGGGSWCVCGTRDCKGFVATLILTPPPSAPMLAGVK